MNSLYFSPKNKRLGDFYLVQKDGKIYCIFIENKRSEIKKDQAITENSYGLACSEDGIKWKYTGRIKEPSRSRWDNKSLWAMDILREKDKYLMLYSALGKTKGDPLSTQQIGLSSSSDLKSWKDVQKEPVITDQQTGKHYYPKNIQKFCWRDPEIIKAKNKYYCLIAAKDKNLPFGLSGCVGLLKSKDLKSWQTLPPIFSPGRYWEIETPHIYKIKGAYYLIFGEYVDGTSMRFATSKSLFGNYTEPRLNTFTPAMCYAGRIIKHNNKNLFYHWIRDKYSNKKESYLSPPKTIEIKNNILFLKKYSEIDKYFKLIPEKNLLAGIKKYNRVKTIKKTRASNIVIKIVTENKEYSRIVSLTNTKQGISIRDYDSMYKVNDLRTIPIKPKILNIETYAENKFLEIYINGYFAYAVIMESNVKNVKKFNSSV